MTGFADLLPRKDLLFPLPSLPTASSAASQGWGWPGSLSPLICGAETRGHHCPGTQNPSPRRPLPSAASCSPDPRAAPFLPALICLSLCRLPSCLAASSLAAPRPDACLCLSAPAREPQCLDAACLPALLAAPLCPFKSHQPSCTP